MHHQGNRTARGATAVAVGLLALLLGSSASAEIDRAQALADMRAIYASLEVLLPLSVDRNAFASPGERDRIRQSLARLADRAGHVAGHVAPGDRRIEFLAGSLARETQEALRRFDEGRVEGARYHVRRLTDFCIACHSRLPSPTDSLLSGGFVSEGALATLPPARRAELQIATRRFGDALASFEALFASPQVRASELLEPLTQYLTVSIRVKKDLARPVPVLRRFLAREDLWENLQEDVEHWVEALERYAAEAPAAKTVAFAAAPLKEAKKSILSGTDRQALVHYLVASARLHLFLEANSGRSGSDVAEAYYRLGLIESRISPGEWVHGEDDFYLETAIRMVPGDPIAKQAFGLLEDKTILGWTGSSGDHMPGDVRQRLEDLRAISQGAAGGAASPE